MKIALVNIPLREPNNPQEWIPLPPRGYGGIQWVVTQLMEGFLELGHTIWLLGAPSTRLEHKRLTVVNAAEPQEIANWLKANILALKIDIIHDHSNGIFQLDTWNSPCPIVVTHHLTGKPKFKNPTVYLSYAQRDRAQDSTSPVIRLPVNPDRYSFVERKDSYLLFLGRVSVWKGAYEAAQFAAFTGLKLKLAGPAWEEDYLKKILHHFKQSVEYIGEVGGEKRIELLSKAKAVLVFSQPVEGPWEERWSEPGSTVVSEAGACGTPTLSTTNGCLKEIVPYVGTVFEETQPLIAGACLKAIENLPSSQAVYQTTVSRWHYLKITEEYIQYFKELAGLKEIERPFFTTALKIRFLVEGIIKLPMFDSESDQSELRQAFLQMINKLHQTSIKSAPHPLPLAAAENLEVPTLPSEHAQELIAQPIVKNLLKIGSTTSSKVIVRLVDHHSLPSFLNQLPRYAIHKHSRFLLITLQLQASSKMGEVVLESHLYKQFLIKEKKVMTFYSNEAVLIDPRICVKQLDIKCEELKGLIIEIYP